MLFEYAAWLWATLTWTWFRAWGYLYALLIEAPVRRLYYDGPRWIGGWEGQSLSTMCASLAPRTEAPMWDLAANHEACRAMVLRHFQSYLVLADLCVAAACLYVVWRVAYDFFWRRRFIKDMKDVLQSIPYPMPLHTQSHMQPQSRKHKIILI